MIGASAGLAGALLLAVSAPAAAAVRSCAPLTLGAAITERTEPVARRKALEDWMQRARVHGIAQPTWRTAIDKSVVCGKVAAGFECQARGAPCVIRQNLGRPSDLPPRRRPGIDA